MNWLAHLLLSEPTPEFRIGNLLPDILPPAELQRLPAGFQRGIACHRRIDAFTDAHPAFRASIQRFGPQYRRFGGILVDMFYDHLLAANWEKHSSESLSAFTQNVYASIHQHQGVLPSEAWERLHAMMEDDWLYSYRDLQNVHFALERIGSRLRKPQALGAAVAVFAANQAEIEGDFEVFFPALRTHVRS